MRPEAGLALAVLLLSGGPALAARTASSEFYTCVDATGRNFSGDLPPPECAAREVIVHNPDGSEKFRIAPPETVVQREQRLAQERRQREEVERACAQHDQERALMETYGNEAALEAARARALAGRQASIERARQRLALLGRERRRLDNEAEFYAKRPQPDELKRAFENNRVLQDQQEHAIAEGTAELARIGASFDESLRLLRKVLGQGETPCPRGGRAEH